MGTAPQCPNVRCIADLSQRIERLEAYEKWRSPHIVDWEKIIDQNIWDEHWRNLERMHAMMKKCQEVADEISKGAAEAVIAQPGA